MTITAWTLNYFQKADADHRRKFRGEAYLGGITQYIEDVTIGYHDMPGDRGLLAVDGSSGAPTTMNHTWDRYSHLSVCHEKSIASLRCEFFHNRIL